MSIPFPKKHKLRCAKRRAEREALFALWRFCLYVLFAPFVSFFLAPLALAAKKAAQYPERVLVAWEKETKQEYGDKNRQYLLGSEGKPKKTEICARHCGKPGDIKGYTYSKADIRPAVCNNPRDSEAEKQPRICYKIECFFKKSFNPCHFFLTKKYTPSIERSVPGADSYFFTFFSRVRKEAQDL